MSEVDNRVWIVAVMENRKIVPMYGEIAYRTKAAAEIRLVEVRQRVPEFAKDYEVHQFIPAEFQRRVHQWMLACFNEQIASDKTERNHRFLEESLELVQSLGCTKSEAHQLVDYVFERPQGEVNQECGGVIVTLAALCTANSIDMEAAGENELARVWTKIEQIRQKQAAKPKHSALPGRSSRAADRRCDHPESEFYADGVCDCGQQQCADTPYCHACMREAKALSQRTEEQFAWISALENALGNSAQIAYDGNPQHFVDSLIRPSVDRMAALEQEVKRLSGHVKK